MKRPAAAKINQVKASKPITPATAETAAYDQDYWSWTRAQACALKAGRLQDLDLPNLAEEIADLGKSEERRLANELARLVEHLLKLLHATDQQRKENSRGWPISVRNSRRKVRKLLVENPGLKAKVKEIFAEAYQNARDATLIALDLPESAVPETCRWNFEQTMADEFDSRPRAPKADR